MIWEEKSYWLWDADLREREMNEKLNGEISLIDWVVVYILHIHKYSACEKKWSSELHVSVRVIC